MRARFFPRARAEALMAAGERFRQSALQDHKAEIERRIAAGKAADDPEIRAIVAQGLSMIDDGLGRFRAILAAHAERAWSEACDEIAALGPAPDLSQLGGQP